MRRACLIYLFLLFAVPCSCQKLSVVSSQGCAEFLFVEVRFQDRFSTATISTPLSGRLELGNYLQSARIEYFDPLRKQWRKLERVPRNRPVGTKTLKPGEELNDLLWADTAMLAGGPSDNIQLRVRIAYWTNDWKKKRFSDSESFTLAGLKTSEFSNERWRNEMRQICDANQSY